MKGDAEWLRTLLGACERGIARLRGVEAPPLALLRDLEELRASVLAQLEALERPAKTAVPGRRAR